MAKRRIFTIGFELPGGEFERIKFSSTQTLLDADIVLFEPVLGDQNLIGKFSNESYNEKPLLPEQSLEQMEHWQSEIIAAVKAGKLVIIYLAKPIDAYRYTGKKEVSGTGRNRAITNEVTKISSYDAVVGLKRVIAKNGRAMKREMNTHYLAPYWSEFSDYSVYEAEIEGDFTHILLKSRAGDRTVGAAIHSSRGALLFLPPLRYDEEKFVRYDINTKKHYWTEEALQFGKRLVATLAALADNLKKSVQSTPPPSWAMGSQYRLTEENELEAAISVCISEIAELQSKKSSLKTQLSEAGSLRNLLFEQGSPLESAILEALRLLGFDAQPHSDGESEFDAVFVSPEGRCIGEAEGKDNKSINIDKFSQLERNIQEDFEREDVTDYAKGVLFGNAYRLMPLGERGDYFTAKCLSAAKRVGAALVRTPDLFTPARYLKENPGDVAYAKQCREAIFRSAGDIVIFPPPPVGDAVPAAEDPPPLVTAAPNIPANTDGVPARDRQRDAVDA